MKELGGLGLSNTIRGICILKYFYNMDTESQKILITNNR